MLHGASACRPCSFLVQVSFLQAAQRGRLRLAAPFGQGLGKIGEQHREPEPQRHGQDEADRRLALAEQRLHAKHGGQHAADIDDEHHRIAPLRSGVELFACVQDGRHQQRRVEHAQLRV
jgi:hypothetical protein